MSEKWSLSDLEECSCYVMDIGGDMMKMGFGGDDAPRAVFPSVVGKGRHGKLRERNLPINYGQKEYYVGDEAQSKRGILALNHPYREGLVREWTEFSKVLHHTFYNEHPLLMTESVGNPHWKREITTEIIFELHDIPAFYLIPQTLCATYSYGVTTGTSLMMGYDTCSSVCCFEGHIVENTMQRLNIGGKHLTEYLYRLLRERGLNYSDHYNFALTRDMKEKLGRFNTIKLSEQPVAEELTYELPDGELVKLGKERIMCPEPLFQPSILGVDQPGIQQMIGNSISRCSNDMKMHLEMVMLCGGSSLFNNVNERLTNEMKSILTKKEASRFRVSSSLERKYSTWIGGSILVSMSYFANQWITKKQYDEYGRKIIHRKCPNFMGSSLFPSVVWSTSTHAKNFGEKSKKMALFLFWCNMKEESRIYSIPTEVMMIIVSFFTFETPWFEEDLYLLKNGMSKWSGVDHEFKNYKN